MNSVVKVCRKATAAVRHRPESSSVLLWPSQPSRSIPGPLYRALQACIAETPADWRRRPGCPRQSWLRTVETDLRPLNLGLATAKRRTQDRAARRRLVATATSTLTSS